MLNTCHLKHAITQKLCDHECLNFILQDHGEIDPWTAQPRIQVAETSPNTIGESEFVGVELLNTKPLVPDSITHWYMSDVLISVDSKESLRSTQIMDAIQCIFTIAPPDYDKPAHTYCCDLSNECITTRKVRFVERPRVGRQGSNTYDAVTNNWQELMFLEIIWSPIGCDCEKECDETLYNPCPIILPHSPNHPNCRCNFLEEDK